MAAAPAYDLMILVATEPEEARTRVVEEVRKQIAAGEGELKGDADWGVRKLAYEIDHRTEAYYHLFQLEAAPALLTQLEHSLSIDDQVVRHRVIKLPKGVPDRTPRPEPPAPRPTESSGEPGAQAPAEAPPAATAASPAEPSPGEAEPAATEAPPAAAEAEAGQAEPEASPQPAEQSQT